MSYSQYQVKKAEKIIRTNGVAELGEGLMQVRSGSDSSQSYIIEGETCDCIGNKVFHKDCVHLLAVKLWKEKHG